jgi:hypothetical protein
LFSVKSSVRLCRHCCRCKWHNPNHLYRKDSVFCPVGTGNFSSLGWCTIWRMSSLALIGLVNFNP